LAEINADNLVNQPFNKIQLILMVFIKNIRQGGKGKLGERYGLAEGKEVVQEAAHRGL
jgi:hypothetical protein